MHSMMAFELVEQRQAELRADAERVRHGRRSRLARRMAAKDGRRFRR